MKKKSFFVGIDTGKLSIFYGVVDSNGQKVGVAKEINNDLSGFKKMLQQLKERKINLRQTVFCIENTGVYSEKIGFFLYENSCRVSYVMPFKIKKATVEKGHKTDPADAIKIAVYGWRYQDTLLSYVPRTELTDQVKTLLTLREQLVKQRTAHKNGLKSLKQKRIRLKEEEKMLEELINYLSNKIEGIKIKIETFVKKNSEAALMAQYILQIKGVGPLLIAHLFVITEGFTKYFAYRTLASYFGICPFKHESGIRIFKAARSDGYGPHLVRKLLNLAARSAANHDENMRHYFLRKEAEGKPYKLVINNIENKILRIICALLRDRRPFIESYRSFNPNLLKRA